MTRRAGAGAQLPVFVTSMWAARRMAVVKWEGLREGGVAWFPDLTQPALDLSAAFVQHLIPLGSAGMILPAAVAATMFTNVALAFGGGHANASRRDTPPQPPSLSCPTVIAAAPQLCGRVSLPALCGRLLAFVTSHQP